VVDPHFLKASFLAFQKLQDQFYCACLLQAGFSQMPGDNVLASWLLVDQPGLWYAFPSLGTV
jgi:hypothetical protein